MRTSDNRYITYGINGGSIKVVDLQTKKEIYHFECAQGMKIYI